MPIHDVGYRSWKGHLTSTWTRWWTISEAGITTVFTSRWIRRIVLASWFPVIYFGILFFVFEKMMETSGSELFRQLGAPREFTEFEVPQAGFGVDEELEAFANHRKEFDNKARMQALRHHPMIQLLPSSEALIEAIDTGDDSVMRNTTWNLFLATFLRYPQGLMTLMIIGLIVPPLISRDVRSRAFLLYYSRPITRMEYLMGKLAIPGFVLMTVTLVPAIALYFFGLMLSPNLSVILDTWDTPFRIVIATAVCVIPTSLIGLLFSSMTQESRFAGFAWFSIWGLGAVVWWVIFLSNSNGGQVPFDSNWSLISLYATIGRVQAWVFGLETDVGRVLPSMIVLGLATVFSFVGLYRRVSAPVRI